MNIVMRRLVATCSALLISACGGGGGGSTVSQSVSAEGAWEGSSSANYAINVLVLENNEMWAIFGTVFNDVFTVYGFDRGVGAQSGSTFSGLGTEYSYTGSAARGSFTATVTPGVSLNGSVTAIQTVSFATRPMRSSYNYNAPATLATVSGLWSGRLLDGSAASISVTSGGSVTGTSGGCSFTGAAAPRPSGKNVFNVTLNFGRSPCVLANQTVSGIGLAYPTTTGRTQLMVGVTDPTNSFGTMFFALR